MNNNFNSWKFVKRFLDADSGMTVEVQRDRSVPWPKCSIRIGRMVPDPDDNSTLVFKPYIPVWVNKPNEEGIIELRYENTLLDLIEDAYDYIVSLSVAFEENKREKYELTRNKLTSDEEKRRENRE